MQKLKDLQDKRLELANKIKSFNDAEIAKGDAGWSAEAEANWKTLNADYDGVMASLNAEVASVQAQTERENRIAEIGNFKPAVFNRIGRDGGTIDAGPVNADVFSPNAGGDRGLALQGWFLSNSGLKNKVTDQHRAAAAKIGCSLDERDFVISLAHSDDFNRGRAQWGNVKNAMSSGVPETGGFTVGSTLINALERAQLDYSGVLQVAEVIRTDNGEPMSWPTIDDTANTGSRVGEAQDAGTAGDPVVGRTAWSAFDFTSGLLNVSRSLLADSIFNLEQTIGSLMGERLGRKQNTDYTTGGGGGNSPAGIVTRATLGKTAASSTAIVWDELIDLEHSIDPSLRGQTGVGYMLHDSILQAVRKLKDGNGQPIWQSGWNAGVPDRLNNRLYWINQAMTSSIASGAKTVLFGKLSQYKVRQVGSLVLQRLVERRAEFNQDVFIAYMRGDGNLLDAGDHPVKYLVH